MIFNSSCFKKKAVVIFMMVVQFAVFEINAKASDHEVPVLLNYNAIWINSIGVSQSGGVLTKTAAAGWSNAGAISSNILAPNTDGWLEFTAVTGVYYIVGFATNNNLNVTDFNNALLLSYSGNTLTAYEGAATTALPVWSAGDVFRISREGNFVKYYRNGSQIRSVAVDPLLEFKVKAALYHTGKTTPVITTSFDANLILNGTVTATDGTNGTGGVSVSVSGGTTPYSYSWSSGETTSSISGKTRGAYSLAVTDAAGRTQSRTYDIGYKSYWVNTIGASESGGILTKTIGTASWTSSGSVSSNVLSPNTDGWMEFSGGIGAQYFIGYATNNIIDYTQFTNAISISYDNNICATYEGSTPTTIGTWQVGDVFKISREGSLVKYYRNGSVVRSVTVDPSLELRLKATLYTTGKTTPAINTSFDTRLILNGVTTVTEGNNGTGSVAVTVSGGTSPYTYSWSGGETTSSISGKARGAYSLAVTDAAGRTQSQTYDIGYKNYWINAVGASESGGILTKTIGTASWANSGSVSSNVLSPNTDGWMEFSGSSGAQYFIGFATNNIIDYTQFTNAIAISYDNNICATYEGSATTTIGTWQVGDVFKISREGSLVKYYRNNIVVRSVTVDPSLALKLKATIYTYQKTTPAISSSFDAQLILNGTTTATDVNNGTGSIAVNVTGGTSPYSYSWSSGEQTNTIVNKSRGAYEVTVTDAAGRTQKRTYNIGFKNYWSNIIGASESGGILTKTASTGQWTNSGAASSNVLKANTDGWLEFSGNSGCSFLVGFASDNITSNTAFTNGIYIGYDENIYSIWEGSTGTSMTTWQTGDIFRISREGSLVKYYRNGNVIRSVTVDPSLELKIKAGLYYVGKTTPAISSSFDAQLILNGTTIATDVNNGTGSIAVNVSGGTSPYSYSWSSGEQTNTIVNKSRGAYEVTVTDAAGRTQKRTYNIGYKNYWINTISVIESGGILTRTASGGSWNSGGVSSNVLKANTDGWVEFSGNSNAYFILGFASDNVLSSTSFTNAIYLVYDSPICGVFEGSSFTGIGPWHMGDVFRISREGSFVKYYRNGAEVRSVPVDPSLELKLKATIYSNGKTTPAISSSFDAQLILNGTTTATDVNNGTGSIAVNVSGGTSPYSYSWSSGEQTNTIVNKSRGAYEVTVTDAAGRTQKRTYNIGYKNYWINTISVIESGGILTRTASGGSWNSGGVSSNVLKANTDGWVEFSGNSNAYFILGFASDNVLSSTSFTNAIYLVYDSPIYGVFEGSSFTGIGPWYIGDVFRISREGSFVKYYRNGAEVRSVPVDPSLELKLKATIYSNGKTTPAISSSFDAQLLLQPTFTTATGTTATGGVVLNVIGGASPYTYRWSTGETTSSITNKLSGSYTVTVTDAAGRSITSSLYIPTTEGLVPDALEFQALKDLYDGLGGSAWTTKTNWPTPGNWPASATNAQFGTWFGVTVTNGDISMVNLPSNNLSGSIPSSIGGLVNLMYLYLQGNQLKGEIPYSMGNLNNLLKLYLYTNKLTGNIPSSLGNLNKLQYLYLQGNQLTGYIPTELGGLFELLTLYLSDNQLSGSLPASLGNLTKLKLFYLYNNPLTGEIPSSFSKLTELTGFYLYQNHLTGNLPDISGWTKLTAMNISQNQFSGAFPSNIATLTLLANITANNNKYSSLPSALLNLPALVYLDFQYNELTTIPNLATHPNKVNLAAYLKNNFIDFNNWEPIFGATGAHGIKTLGYYPQNKFNEKFEPLKIYQPAGGTLQIKAAGPGQFGTITWEKKLTTWSNVNATNQDATQKCYKIINTTNSIDGAYHWIITDSKVPLLTLQSEDISVVTTDDVSILTASKAKYNGLITAVRWRTDEAYKSNEGELKGVYLYDYDEKYQIKEAIWGDPNYVLNNFDLQQNKFRLTGLTYDPNGNIQTLKRYDKDGQRTNNFTYHYKSNKNQLTDVTGYTNAYTYNNIGQMVGADKQTGDDQIVEYDVTGKVTNVYKNVSPPTGILGEYNFSGNLNNTNGSLETAVAYAAIPATDRNGLVNSAYQLDGIDDFLKITDNNDVASFNSSDFTVSFWVKKISNAVNSYAGIGKWNYIGSVGTNEWIINLGAGSFIPSFMIESGSDKYQAIGTTTIPLSQWCHILAEREGSQIKLYVNGNLESSVSVGSVVINNTTAPLYIGRTGLGNFSNAVFDEIKIYKAALNDDQVKNLYQTGNNKLVLHNVYDDRGFRLAKINYETNKTTWYIRDASGNVLSIYEQDGIDATTADKLTQTEVPIYGSGKLGTMYPQQDLSLNYEVTDHLGNVRALLRDNVRVYTATMEDNGTPDITNPRVEEIQYFNNLFETEKANVGQWLNHTPPSSAVPSPKYAAYLDGTGSRIIGPAMTLKVNAGDVISAKAFAKFEESGSYGGRLSLTAIAAALTGTYAFSAGLENIATTSQAFNGAVNAMGVYGDDGSERPQAYLNFILFDKDFNYINSPNNIDRICLDAGFAPGQEYSVAFDELKVGVKAQQAGYIYIYVSNETPGSRVWFDDLTVTHNEAIVTQASDYGVWGDVLREQKSDESTYRFGYQGQYAEKDDETGWSHFELREYDPVIGRWNAIDPNMQYYSPYLSMGNNPVSSTDPDGGFDEYDMINGEKVWVSNKGGSDVEYINYYENVDSGFGNGTTASVYTGTSAQALTNAGKQQLGGAPLAWSYEGIVIDYVRTTYTNKSTVGKFTTSSGNVEGYYLEPVWDESKATTQGSDRAVEPGTYYLIRHISKKYTEEEHAYRLLAPHGRVTILQHTGNGPDDTTGCFLPGSSTSTDYVSGSTAKREQLHNLIKGNKFGSKIIVRDTNQGTPRSGYGN